MSSAASRPLSTLQMYGNALRDGVPVSPFINRILNGSRNDVFIIENTNPIDDGDLSVKYIIDDVNVRGVDSTSDRDNRFWDWKSLHEVNILQYIPAVLASWGNWTPGDEFYTQDKAYRYPPQCNVIIELPSDLKYQFFIRTINLYNNTIHDWTADDVENANIVTYVRLPPSSERAAAASARAAAELQAAAAALSSSSAAGKYWHGKGHKGHKGKKRGGSIKHKRRIRLKKTLKRKTK